MRFKTDENVHPEIADLLRAHGHDAVTIWDQGLRGNPDSGIASVCRSEGRTIVTFDLGFSDIREYPPEEFSGIIVLRLALQHRRHVYRAMQRVISMLAREPLAGRLWIVEESDLRIR
ncbi:MAG TPA: DUF5615 family PIN-like protein [Phycisphaerae bacterium]|nr:DUF5615 family PIN-like protein [Phycisphaerae bacterium]